MNPSNEDFGRATAKMLFTEDKLSFLKKEKAVGSLARIIALIESKQGPDSGDWLREERYENIQDCLETHVDSIDDLEHLTNRLLISLQKAKEILLQESRLVKVAIHDETTIHEAKLQFERLLGKISQAMNDAYTIVERIKEKNDELLYCFFNYKTWGSTWSTELYIPKKMYETSSWEDIVETAVNRVLKFHLYSQPSSLTWNIVHDYEESLFNRLGEDYDEYTYSRKDYLAINARICNDILNHFTDIVVKLRDTCRTVLLEISEYRNRMKTLGDPSFKRVVKKILSTLFQDADLKQNLSGKNLKKEFFSLLTLIYDYKREVEESEWRVTSSFEKEREFKDHLFNYLNRTRRGTFWPSKEAERGRGHVDILVRENLVLELKFQKNPTTMSMIPKHYPQIRETMENWQSKLGVLVVLDVSPQKEPMASLENYFDATVVRGGRGMTEAEDKYPVGVVSVIVFGGIRARPSSLSG